MLRKSKMLISLLMGVIMIFGCFITVTATADETVDTLAVQAPTFVEVTAPSIHMTVGDTMQLSYVVLPLVASITLSWASGKSSVATVSSSGLVTALSTGSVTITLTARSTMTGGGSLSDTVTLYVHDDTGIKSGTAYYIMNAASSRFLSLETTSDADKANVYTRQRSNTTMSRWTPIKYSNSNQYKIKSNYSPTSKCLDVSDGNIDIYTDTGGGYLKFTIDRVESGTYQGLYLIRYDGKYYVTQDSNYNVYITTTLSAASYWSFMAVEKRYADYYSISEPDTRAKVSDYQTVMESMGYTSNNWHCATAIWAYGALASTNDIFTFVGHGFEPLNVPRAGISFQTDSGGDNGNITAQPFGSGDKNRAISDLDDNKLALSRCVLYLGCNAGTTYTVNGESSNLVDETFKKGAHFVLAPTQRILDGQAYAFLEDFLSKCSTKNIYDSISETIIDSHIFDAYYLGDTEQFLCIP